MTGSIRLYFFNKFIIKKLLDLCLLIFISLVLLTGGSNFLLASSGCKDDNSEFPFGYISEISHSCAPELLSLSPYLAEIEGWIEVDGKELAQKLIPEAKRYLSPNKFLEITSLFILNPEHRLSHINGWFKIYKGFAKDYQNYSENQRKQRRPSRKSPQVEREHMCCLLEALIYQYQSFSESLQGREWDDLLAAESEEAELQAIHIKSRLEVSQTHRKYLDANQKES